MVDLRQSVGLTVAVLAGCGRIGFGSNDDRDGATADSPPVPDAYVCVAGMDACNGIDDDCDGQLDEDCACTPFTLRVALDIQMLESPALAWTGDGYVVATSQNDRLFLQRVAESGTLVGAPAAVSSGAFLGPMSAVYTGADVVITWTEADQARLGVMSPTAVRTLPDRAIGHKDEGPFLAWNGSVLAMVSVQVGFPIDFARYNGLGQYGGGTGLVGINDEVRSLAWVGSGFAVGLRARTNPRSARYYDWSADAMTLGSVREVGGNRVGFVGAATAGAEHALGSALVDASGVVLVPHDLTGTATGPEQIVLTNTGETDLGVGVAWSGASYMVVATDEETGTQRVQLQKCGADGVPLELPEGIPSPVIAGQQIRRPTTISAAHQRVAAAWTADEGGVISLVVVQRCY